jgi:hypothetical protein
MRSIPLVILMVALAASLGFGQEQKSWTELTKRDAEKLLTDSPWARSQVDTDVSELFYSPTKPGTSSIGKSQATIGKITDQQSINNNRSDEGAKNEAVSVNYHIRLFSARPIREAIARLVVLNQDQRYEELTSLMQPFVDRNFGPFVVFTVSVDSNDGRALGPVLQALSSATADTLRNKTYLERKDGKRLYLMDYRAPQADGLGAKFVFERAPDGKTFVDENSGNFRFYSEVGDKIKLNVKFAIAELVYNGKLEF